MTQGHHKQRAWCWVDVFPLTLAGCLKSQWCQRQEKAGVSDARLPEIRPGLPTHELQGGLMLNLPQGEDWGPSKGCCHYSIQPIKAPWYSDSILEGGARAEIKAFDQNLFHTLWLMVYLILRKPISPILTIKNFPILLMTPHPNSVYCVCEYVLSHALFYATPCTAARQAPLSMGFSRQEYWSGLPFPSLGDLPDPGIEPESLALQAGSLLLSHLGGPVWQLTGA